jgi:urease accessory protein
MAQLQSHIVRRHGAWSNSTSQVVLTYDARFLRRKVIQTQVGDMLVDLEHTMSIDHGDAFELTDGRFIECIAADEPLLKVRGDLVHLAWHIGNRHSPCQIEPEYLLIQHNHVMADMLSKLGAHVEDVVMPFTPLGGAYGHGRTHGHDHESGHAH